MKSIYFVVNEDMLKGIKRASDNDSSIIIGRIVTGEAFIIQDGRKEIIEKYNPLFVDMETSEYRSCLLCQFDTFCCNSFHKSYNPELEKLFLKKHSEFLKPYSEHKFKLEETQKA